MQELSILFLPLRMPKLKNKGASSNNSRTSWQEVSPNNCFKHRTFASWLWSHDHQLREFNWVLRLDLTENILKLVNDRNKGLKSVIADWVSWATLHWHRIKTLVRPIDLRKPEVKPGVYLFEIVLHHFIYNKLYHYYSCFTLNIHHQYRMVVGFLNSF